MVCKTHTTECTGIKAIYYFLVSNVNGDPGSHMVSIQVLVYSEGLDSIPITGTDVKNKKITRRCQYIDSRSPKDRSRSNLRSVVNSTHQRKAYLRQWAIPNIMLVY
jgi:hypothetical protein